MSYEVFILRRAQKQLAQFPTHDYERVRTSILALGSIPRPHGCLKLAGRPGWRIRVGDYRVIYEIDDQQRRLTVLDVGNRRDVYN
jgi:mRNA interferase RelE/StbE